MRLVQFKQPDGSRRVGRVEDDGDILRPLDRTESVYSLAQDAIAAGRGLEALADERAGQATTDYQEVIDAGRLLPPVDHPDPAHFFVTGTGITHLGSADARDRMHAKMMADDPALTDSMKMFRLGIEGGKPPAGEVGAQPEWFYKGDGSCVAPPGAPLAMPSFALAGGEEVEIVGLYLIDPDGRPRRLGFALGNEFSDHLVEEQNYLYGAHSKLRACSIGPELRTGAPPDDIRGRSRVYRDGAVLWEDGFLSGEANMCHSIANLEHHHFKYPLFRRPGDLHAHFLGAAVLSFAAGVRTRPGDLFEIEAEGFGRPLRNPLARDDAVAVEILAL